MSLIPLPAASHSDTDDCSLWQPSDEGLAAVAIHSTAANPASSLHPGSTPWESGFCPVYCPKQEMSTWQKSCSQAGDTVLHKVHPVW